VNQHFVAGIAGREYQEDSHAIVTSANEMLRSRVAQLTCHSRMPETGMPFQSSRER
jgi:hypothetical protein